MKKITLSLGAAAIAAFVSGCQVTVSPPFASVEVSTPVVEVVPTTYIWDGYEYVGEVNGSFYYFGPGGVWLAADPVILGRWHGFVDIHPDWRARVIVNDREHRLDREHRNAAPARAVEHREAAPRPGAAPGRRPATPARKPEEKKRDDNH